MKNVRAITILSFLFLITACNSKDETSAAVGSAETATPSTEEARSRAASGSIAPLRGQKFFADYSFPFVFEISGISEGLENGVITDQATGDQIEVDLAYREVVETNTILGYAWIPANLQPGQYDFMVEDEQGNQVALQDAFVISDTLSIVVQRSFPSSLALSQTENEFSLPGSGYIDGARVYLVGKNGRYEWAEEALSVEFVDDSELIVTLRKSQVPAGFYHIYVVQPDESIGLELDAIEIL